MVVIGQTTPIFSPIIKTLTVSASCFYKFFKLVNGTAYECEGIVVCNKYSNSALLDPLRSSDPHMMEVDPGGAASCRRLRVLINVVV